MAKNKNLQKITLEEVRIERMNRKVSWVMGFLTRWALRSKVFGQKSTVVK